MPNMTTQQLIQEATKRASHINKVEGGRLNASLLSTLNVASLRNLHITDWSFEIWDKKSPINGVPAETMLARHDVPAEGEIYLIKNKGNVVIFQPHTPNDHGINKMNALDVGNHAQGHFDGIMDELTLASMLNLI